MALEDWQLLVLGGGISTVTSAVIQLIQGSRERALQEDRFAHERRQQEEEWANQAARQHAEWNRQREDQHKSQQLEILTQLQGEVFKIVHASRAMCEERSRLGELSDEERAKEESDEYAREWRRSTGRQFEDARAQVYALGASVEDPAIREALNELVPMVESLMFTPRERHRSPDPFYRSVEVRNEISRMIGRIRRGESALPAPSVGVADEMAVPQNGERSP
jgi:hypothetical protein